MNTAGVMLQPFLQTKEITMQANGHTSAESETSPFQHLLKTAQEDGETEVQQLLQSNDEQKQQNQGESAENALQQLIANLIGGEGDGSSEQGMAIPEDVMKKLTAEGKDAQLSDMLENLQEALTKLGDGDGSSEQGMAIPEDVMEKLTGEGKDAQLSDMPENLQAAIEKLLTDLDGKAGKANQSEEQKIPVHMTMPKLSQIGSDGQTVQQQFKLLFAAADKQLNQINDQASLSKAAPELLQLLKKWSALAKKTHQQPGNVLETISGHDDKNQKIWKDLVQSFQKRQQFTMKQQYHTNAKVTNRDVAKWLQNAIQTQDKPAPKQAAVMSSSLPMSKVEQYVIHLNQTQNSQPAGQQLMDQVQKVMKTSSFLKTSNGASQLNISLRPDNLGDMQVKLTQLNGEMTVKIVVSTAAAKDMLETNMHQLKNMFSPQQVMIEKQDSTAQEAQSNLQDEHGQPMDSDEQEESEHSGQKEDEEDDDDSFDDELEAIMTGEEVTL
ncbi:hypothetical protein GCM10028778_03440 [Barrientosiimonas marina]|uniref:Flagellar hook-length control protein FliK n=1 Tax=Lentibacillus kimchii TaxID=1542911 RepID=A0ABW2UQ28_9BACI